jgi:hypothetical protein
MRDLLILALWLGTSTVYLADSAIIATVLGIHTRPAVRQGGLAAPLAFTALTLLATPWAPWTAAFLTAALALHLAAHLVGMGRVAAGLVAAPPALAERVDELARRWGTDRPDRILLDPADSLEPGVMGFWRQSLILPQGALALPEAEFAAVVAHELAHVAARDPLKLWLTGFARTLLGWHPIARKLTDGIALEVEMAADRQATAWLGDTDAYALALGRWGLRRSQGRPSSFGVALTGTSSHLMLRLHALLNPSAPPPHLEIPRWVPGAGRANRNRAAGRTGRRPPTESFVRRFHLVVTAGYLALFLFLIRLV